MDVFQIHNGDYIQLSSSDNKINIYKDTSSGNLDVSKVLNPQRHPTESDTTPLVITNTNSSGAGFIGKLVSTMKGWHRASLRVTVLHSCIITTKMHSALKHYA